MNKYIFTFGCGQELAGKCQPIYAGSWEKAREIMVEQYGTKWAFQYDEEQWEQAKERAEQMGYKSETELPPKEVTEDE